MLVLASASPRRRDLLTQAGFTFQVDSIPIAEVRQPGESPEQFVRRLAREKAEVVFHARTVEPNVRSSTESLIVLGADTVVVCDNEVMGKPADEAAAVRMLRMLSGKTHRVLTGVCLISSAGIDIALESTSVTMRALSEEEIRAYVATGEHVDKAGAYAIQGRASRFIPKISGCYFNVVGLPVARVSAMLKDAEQQLSLSAGTYSCDVKP